MDYEKHEMQEIVCRRNDLMNKKIAKKITDDEAEELEELEDYIYLKVNGTPRMKRHSESRQNKNQLPSNFYELSDATNINSFFIHDSPVISINGARGSRLDVYNDYAVITTKTTIGSILGGSVTNGQKVIFYSDCIGLQHKPCGLQLGLIQLETASGTIHNSTNQFFNENTFVFEGDYGGKIMKAYKFILKRLIEIKTVK